jgi:hypothetical protein
MIIFLDGSGLIKYSWSEIHSISFSLSLFNNCIHHGKFFLLGSLATGKSVDHQPLVSQPPHRFTEAAIMNILDGGAKPRYHFAEAAIINNLDGGTEAPQHRFAEAAIINILDSGANPPHRFAEAAIRNHLDGGANPPQQPQ